jgi:5-formyltetrahydrofolate cyclo-ligase
VIPSHRLKRLKAALRREIRARRDDLSPGERARRSAVIADRLFELPELRAAGTVMAFASFGSEVDTAPVLERLHAAGIRLALPRIEDGEVVPAEYRPGDPVTQPTSGAAEPLEGAAVPEAQIDVIVTPGVAFDRRGYRTGYGGGYYDRFFRRVRPDAFRVAVCFALQVVPEVPHGPADLPVDAIVTEDDVLRCRARFER